MADMLSATWREYKQWAATSAGQKKRVTRAGMLVLGLTLAGTLFGTMAPFGGGVVVFCGLLKIPALPA